MSKTLNNIITAAVQDAQSQNLGDGGVWRAACDAVVQFRLENNTPFSSGEVAAILRTFDQTLVFSVGSVGERLRDAFFAGEFLFNIEEPVISYDDFGMPEVNDDGDLLYKASDGTTPVMSEAMTTTGQYPAEQVTRYTEGLGRTPAQTMVFVYAPSYEDGEEHDFEVDIPRPNEAADINPTTGVPDEPKAHPSTRDHTSDDDARAAQVARNTSSGDLTCTVQTTGRMNVGRAVLESYALLTRQSLQADSRVFVWVDGDELTLRLANDDTTPAEKSYKLFRGRTLINIAKMGLPRPAGASYTPKVGPGGVTINL